MAKRFIETGMFEKPLVSSLEAPYKLLFLYYITKCDHAGFFDIYAMKFASFVLGHDYSAEEFENQMQGELITIGNKWFMPSFVRFQYGKLNESNRAHKSVIDLLEKNGIDQDTLIPFKGLLSPLEGCKDKDTVKVKDEDKEIPKIEEVIEAITPKLHDLNSEWTSERARKAISLKYETCIQQGWKDGHGNKISNWKLKFVNMLKFEKPWSFGKDETPHRTQPNMQL
jgi:hypothetical protein